MLRIRTGEARRRALVKSILSMELAAIRDEERQKLYQQQRREMRPSSFPTQREKFSNATTRNVLEQLAGVTVQDRGVTAREGVPEPRRCQRVASLIQHALSMAIIEQRFPLLADEQHAIALELVHVKMTPDLRRAIVYYLPPQAHLESWQQASPQEKARVARKWEEKITKSKGQMRKVVGERVRTRYVPDLEFRMDDVSERVDKLNDIFESDM